MKAWVVDDHRDNDDSREGYADAQREWERHRKGERERKKRERNRETDKVT